MPYRIANKSGIPHFFRACGAAAPVPFWKRFPLIDSLPGCHRCDLVSLFRLCSSDSLPVRIVLVQMLSTNGGRFLCTCKEACSGHMTVPMRKSRMAHNEHSIPTAIQTACVPTGEPLQCHNAHSIAQIICIALLKTHACSCHGVACVSVWLVL